MLIQKDLLNKLIDLASYSAEYLNSKKWVTIDGNHVLIEDNKKEEEKKAKTWHKTEVTVKTLKGGEVTIIDSRNNLTKIRTTKSDNLDLEKYPEIDIVVSKVKKRGTELKTENLITNEKLLQKFLDKGYEVISKTNETPWDDSYHLKAKTEENKQELKKRIMETPLEKYDVKKYTIDWGKKDRKQGKRIGGDMVIGSMSDAPTGKKEYTSILGNLPEYETDLKHGFAGDEYMQLAYLKARNYGMNQEEAEKFAFTIREESLWQDVQ